MNFSSDPINTLENLIARNKTKSISIYLMVVLAVITAFVLLPVIKVDISSQSRGIIRSRIDNVPLATIVSGKVTWLDLKKTQTVTNGDKLIKISKESLQTDKRLRVGRGSFGDRV